nr:hypothetical protein [Luteimonas salinisoli]
MLPTWLEKLRHPAQFAPQFEALAGRILAQAHPDDLARAHARIAAMLATQRPHDAGARGKARPDA